MASHRFCNFLPRTASRLPASSLRPSYRVQLALPLAPLLPAFSCLHSPTNKVRSSCFPPFPFLLHPSISIPWTANLHTKTLLGSIWDFYSAHCQQDQSRDSPNLPSFIRCVHPAHLSRPPPSQLPSFNSFCANVRKTAAASTLRLQIICAAKFDVRSRTGNSGVCRPLTRVAVACPFRCVRRSSSPPGNRRYN